MFVLKPTTQEQALDLHVSSRQRLMELGLSDLRGSCHVRAELMAGWACLAGIDARIVVFEPDIEPPGWRPVAYDIHGVRLAGPNGEKVAWLYHCAIVVCWPDANGWAEVRVIDPPFFLEPPTLDDWVFQTGGGFTGKPVFPDGPLSTYLDHRFPKEICRM